MADKGPFLTACIIFYLSIGAAIFQILEESNWESAKSQYALDKQRILERYPCLTKESLEEILEMVSEAAVQGVPIAGDKYITTWDWANSVTFAATIVTTIGYGDVAPKTVSGRLFCILYGLCGIPLCLVWISELGSFFGDRAKRLSQVLIRRGVSIKKVQFICTALFLLWGLFLHLVIPPFIFMSVEEWSYLEGLYFCFITLTTVGFGDYVAGTNPNIIYPSLYKFFTSLWIYMGLAWLSLFFSWNVHMVVKAHKVFKKKRRQRHKLFYDEPSKEEEKVKKPHTRPNVIDIFKFMSEEVEDYSTVIQNIGETKDGRRLSDLKNRSKSCSDMLDLETLDHSPRHRRILSISEVFINKVATKDAADKIKKPSVVAQEASGKGDNKSVPEDSGRDVRPEGCDRQSHTAETGSNSIGSDDGMVVIAGPTESAEEETSQPLLPTVGTRFKVDKVTEIDLQKDGNKTGEEVDFF